MYPWWIWVAGPWGLVLAFGALGRSARRTPRPDAARPYFGAIRIAPSRRIVSPLSMGFATMCATSGRVLRRVARGATGAGPARRASRCAPAGSVAKQRGVEQPRRDGADPDADRGEVAGDRQRHADDAALRRRVRGLADLPVEGRDRGGVDDDAAVAGAPASSVSGSFSLIACAASRMTLKVPTRLTVEDLREVLERERSLASRGAVGVADARAVDRDAQRPEPGAASIAARDLLGVGRRRPAAKTARSPSSFATCSPAEEGRSRITTDAPARAASPRSPGRGRTPLRSPVRRHRRHPRRFLRVVSGCGCPSSWRADEKRSTLTVEHVDGGTQTR